jgi:hypothetical protein
MRQRHIFRKRSQYAPEEIRNGKTKAAKNVRKKNDRFVSFLMRKRFPI